ncbi:PAS domain S-box-containing protein [Mucilaginibacter sp. UYP25]|uniref:PAS domain-containing protein n=1 Tax=unclassified Mucilaginibacter TaxID=2617802 RepID=UPI0033960875
MDTTFTTGPEPEELTIFEALPENYLLLSADFRILGASDRYLHTTNKDRAAIIGKDLFDSFSASDGGIRGSLDRVLENGERHELPVTRFDMPGCDGQLTERYWKTVHQPVKNPDGSIRYIIHHTTEHTEQVFKEIALQASVDTERAASFKAQLVAEQMERLFHDIPAQIAIVRGPDLIYDYINPQYQRELFPGRDVLGLPLLAALPEIEGQPIWDILQTVYQTGEPFIENELLIPLAAETGGEVTDHYFNLVYQPLRDEAGEVYALLSFKYEVTGHVAARKELENRRAELLEAYDKLGSSYEELQALHDELQASNEEMIATNDQLQLTQADLQSLNSELEQRVKERTRELEESVEEQQTLNEEVSSANEELMSTNEELAATNEELSETQLLLQQTLSGLTASEQRFRNLVRDASVGIILLTGDNMKVEIVNNVYGQLIGRTAGELEGKSLFEVIPESEAIFRPVIERVRESGEPLYLYDTPYVVYKDDEAISGFLNLVYQPYREPDGTITGVMVLCQDVSEQVKARQQTEKSEERFRFMLNAIPQQVWTAEPNGALNYVNQVVADDFGFDGPDIVGQGWQNFIHQDDLAGCMKAWVSSITKGTPYLTEFRLRMNDGSYRWHLARALPYRENGEISLWLGTNTDIELQKTNEQRKDEFLSIASHELKTPLTSIKAFNQIMQRSGDNGNLKPFINRSTDQIFRLEKLINDLLDVSRINAGKVSYDAQPFDFLEMVKDAVEVVRLKSPRHEIRLEQSVSVEYTGDRIRLEQVMNNFLTNAVKYSPEGGQILVNTQLLDESVVVAVQDFGIGIAESHLDKLFDRYYRVDNTAMRFEGLGLGLYISSEILKRHGGTFWIESKERKGSTFYFRLPLVANHAEQVLVDDHIYYQDPTITIIYNEEKQRLDVDWTGFQDMTSVKNGGAQMLRMLAHNKVNKVFNDNTHVLGNWSEAAEWTGKEWFPAMEAAGLRYFAWVFSPSAFSKLAAEKSVDLKVGDVVTQFFTDTAEAGSWLEQCV